MVPFKNSTFKILVVDDDTELLHITKLMLKNELFHVITAVSGEECLQTVLNDQPDLILLDVMLPDSSGVDICNKIKSDPLTSSIFIILLSGFKTESEDISMGLEYGADGYLVKPIKKRELLARVDAAVRIIHTEKELRASETRFKTIFNEAPLGIALIDSLNGHLYSVNPTFAKIAGRTLAEISNINWIDITHPDDIQEELDNMALMNAGKTNGFQMDKRFLHKDGTPEWIHMIVSPIDLSDKDSPHYLCMIKDITDRKKSELEIKQKNEELQKISAEKDKFFSIIAHDLRGPFNGFLGLTQLLANELPSLTMDNIQKISVTMSNSASNLYSLLGNLLEWSTTQRGLTIFAPISFELKPKIDESIAGILEMAKSKEISVSYHIPDSLIVFADTNMFESIIRNLTTNAVKFSLKGGNIKISAKQIDNHFAEIAIEDKGIGMNKYLIDNLFRLDVKTSRKGTEGESSTGLGLIICKDFIEKNGGMIRVESEEGKGSTFYFTLKIMATN